MLTLAQIEKALAALERRKGYVRSEWSKTMRKTRKGRTRGGK